MFAEAPPIPDFLRRQEPAQPEKDKPMAGPASIARDQLRAIVERVEKLNEEKAAITGDIKEVFAEAKANGYDVKTLKKVIKLRAMDTAERQEAEALLDLYLHALGMTPLEEAIEKSREAA